MSSGNVDRDPKDMRAFVTAWDDFSADIRRIAGNLQSCCGEARIVLQDEYTAKMIATIEDFADMLVNTVKQGEEPVRELERSAKTLEELDDLER